MAAKWTSLPTLPASVPFQMRQGAGEAKVRAPLKTQLDSLLHLSEAVDFFFVSLRAGGEVLSRFQPIKSSGH